MADSTQPEKRTVKIWTRRERHTICTAKEEFNLSWADAAQVYNHIWNDTMTAKRLGDELRSRDLSGRSQMWKNEIVKDAFTAAEQTDRTLVTWWIMEAAEALGITLNGVAARPAPPQGYPQPSQQPTIQVQAAPNVPPVAAPTAPQPLPPANRPTRQKSGAKCRRIARTATPSEDSESSLTSPEDETPDAAEDSDSSARAQLPGFAPCTPALGCRLYPSTHRRHLRAGARIVAARADDDADASIRPAKRTRSGEEDDVVGERASKKRVTVQQGNGHNAHQDEGDGSLFSKAATEDTPTDSDHDAVAEAEVSTEPRGTPATESERQQGRTPQERHHSANGEFVNGDFALSDEELAAILAKEIAEAREEELEPPKLYADDDFNVAFREPRTDAESFAGR